MAKTIAEAKRQGKSTYTGKDGKAKAAVTREELVAWEKKTGKKGLGAFLNAQKSKGQPPKTKTATSKASGATAEKKQYNNAVDFNNKLRLQPAKSTAQRKLTPAKSTAERKLTPAKSTAERKLTPAKSTAQRKLTPAKSTAERKLTPAKVTAKRRTETMRSGPTPRNAVEFNDSLKRKKKK